RVQFSGRAFELEHGRGPDSPDRWARSRGAVIRFEARALSLPGNIGERSMRGRVFATCSRAARGIEDLVSSSLPRAPAALLNAMLLGKTDDLNIKQRESFQRTGLVHLFSVSGFHTMLVGLLTYRLLGILGLGKW